MSNTVESGIPVLMAMATQPLPLEYSFRTLSAEVDWEARLSLG
jgi:hypothetical protein